MKMHLTDGQLRAYQDNQLGSGEREGIEKHLSTCSSCQKRARDLSRRSHQVEQHLAAIAPPERPSAQLAYSRLQTRISEKENNSMLAKIFSRRFRLAWAAVGLVVILGIALAFPEVRAIANSFLGLFRVQQFSVVQVDPENLSEQLGSSSQFEYMLSNDVHIEEMGDPQEVADATEASALAGIPVRLPGGTDGAPTLMVQPGADISFTIDLPLVRALLQELGQGDLDLPDSIDGATVEMVLPTAVAAGYGECKLDMDSQAALEADMDPDNASLPALDDCIILVQMASPTISAPPGLDITKIGEAYLQVLGMSPQEAAQFSSTVDWTTTLVLPIPRYGTNYKDVSVDGVKGTLIQQKYDNRLGQYALVWVKNDILYAITGQGDGDKALGIAAAIK
jgi:hypothetical protein